MRSWNLDMSIGDDIVSVTLIRKTDKRIDDVTYLTLDDAFKAVQKEIEVTGEWY